MSGLISFSGCENCSLRKDWPLLKTPRMPVALPREKGPYEVMLIGEAPGADEDQQGIPFVGKAGKYLRDQIPNEWRYHLYWGNTVRCRPTEKSGTKNRTPSVQEIRCCSTYLERDLDILKPQAILCLGDIALKWFWESAWITGVRGIPIPIQLPNGNATWMVSTFHPSYVMRQDRDDFDTGKTTNTMLPVFRNDIKNFFRQVPSFSNNPPKIYKVPKREDFIYPKTREEALALADRLKDPYAVDLETFKLKPYLRDARILTSAFSDGDLTFAFPVNWPGNLCPWGLEVFNIILKKKRRWIAQHSNFEYIWVWDSTKSHDHDFDDIEVLARLIHKRKGVGSLDVLSRIYLGIDIKDVAGRGDYLVSAFKHKLLEFPIEDVLYYNGIDAWSEREIYEVLIQKASDVDLENYVRIIDTIKSTVGMEIKGLDVSLEESDKLKKQFTIRLKEYEQQSRQISEVAKYEKETQKIFKPSAPEQVGHVLVNYCGLELPKTPKETQYSTNEKDLTPLAGKHKLVDLVLDYREVAKLLSTYIDPIYSTELIGVDGLIHPSYTVVRTATYRLSCEGPNIQNFPKRSHKEIRRQIIAPKGHIFVAFDYAQLEGRVIAMFSNDTNLRKAFIEDEDIHWKWLYRIIDLYPQYMDRLAKISHETDEKKILKAGRTIIKTDFVFASFYGSQPNSLATRTQIPLNIMEKVLSEFWSLYPSAERWVKGQVTKYQETGQVESLTGRARNEVLPGNEITNSPVQGLAAELVLEAQNALFLKAVVEENENFFPRVNIHDDIMQLPVDDSKLGDFIESSAAEIVKPRFNFITVPLSSECRVGYNWAELETVKTFSGSYFSVSN
jgi:uracil-DNA glycosylase family 4